jgi:phage FluMu gp28-like protein
VAREGERLIDFPGGGWLQVRSADDPDSLRGEGLDFIVLDECAFIQEKAWSEALRPALSDRRGRALFISTPKGMNWFWREWVKGDGGDYPEWRAWRFPTSNNPYIAPDEIEAARLGLPERVFQQEYLAEFMEDAGGVFRKVRAAIDAGRSANELPKPGQAYRIGVDLARVQDWTVIDVFDAGGRQVYHERFNQISWERQSEAVKRVSLAYNNAGVLLDSTGVGDPIFERLQGMNVNVSGYLFTNRSKEQLINALALGIEQADLRLMDIEEQTAELLAFQYELTPSRNVKMSAPEGMHDDCVIALALAAHAAPAWEFYSS